MSTERLKIGSRFLAVLLFTALALPAWGASPGKKPLFTTVAKSGGNYTSPVTAMANVSAWCGSPSATNPCLVKIMPGVYDLGGSSLTMREYVDIEGSGETATIITSETHVDYPDPPAGVVNGASHAELRFLTVATNKNSDGLVAAIINNGASPRITYVTATATATAISESYGIYNYNSSSPTMSNVTATAASYLSYGVMNLDSSPTMSNVTATASAGINCTGVFNSRSSVTMSYVTVTASGCESNTGISNGGSSVIMSHVTVSLPCPDYTDGSCYGLTNASSVPVTILADQSTFVGFAPTDSGQSGKCVENGSNVTMRIGGSKLIGPVSNSGTLTCAASYNGDYVALGTNCQ